MYIDSHFHMTYIVARMAGFNSQDARVVAYAAQQIDDNLSQVTSGMLTFSDGSAFSSRWTLLPTTVGDLAGAYEENRNIPDVFDTWFMYHFIAPCFDNSGSLINQVTTPATDGNGNQTNPTAWKLMDYVLSQKGQKNSLHLLGAALHMFCDTYSHQQFHGMNDPFNSPLDGYTTTAPTAALDRGERFDSWVANEVVGPIGHVIAMDLCDRPCGTYSWTHANPVEAPFTATVTRSNAEHWINCISAIYKIMLRFQGGQGEISTQQLAAFQTIFADPKTALCQTTFSSDDYTKRAQLWLDCIRTGKFTTDSKAASSVVFIDRNGNHLFDAAQPSTLEPDFADYIGLQWYVDALNQSAIPPAGKAAPTYTVPSGSIVYYSGYYFDDVSIGATDRFDRQKFNASNFALFMEGVESIYNTMVGFYAAAGITRPGLSTVTDATGKVLTQDEVAASVRATAKVAAAARTTNLV